jgi:hypothetical protein
MGAGPLTAPDRAGAGAFMRNPDNAPLLAFIGRYWCGGNCLDTVTFRSGAAGGADPGVRAGALGDAQSGNLPLRMAPAPLSGGRDPERDSVKLLTYP